MDAVVGVLVERTIQPILNQLDYLLRYKENIKEVDKKLETLGTAKDTVEILVSQEKGKGNAIFNEVTKWLENAKEVLDMAQQNEGPNNPSCFNCVQRHQLSIKGKNQSEKIGELIDEGRRFNKDNISYPVPSPDTTSSTLSADYQTFESRTLMTEKIKDALANPNINKVGVSGMGGVGKTALLSEIKKLVLETSLFDRVIQVEVGQSKSIIQIQEEIKTKLNIELNTQCTEVRASYILTYIVGRKENILFILDDLWKEYDVEKDFGIPCRSKSRIEGCKILMISRSQHILQHQLNIEKLFEVNSLSNQESWKFFVTIVGEFVEDECIQQIAKEVVKECGGLPIALKILAKALKGKRVEVWKDALKKLKNPVAVNIPRVSDQLYSCIQFSYDSIEDEAKLVLLLCSVFPDDFRIEVKDLQMYAMGMGLLNHINTWEDAKNRVIKLVDDLKSSYLLLAHNEGDRYVQMHDVVHDFSKYVASKNHKMSSLTYGSEQREWEEGDRHGSYQAIYVDCTTFLELPPKLEFPNLQLFIFNRGRQTTGIQISDNFFEEMEELRVLDMRTMCYAPSLTHSLKNLQTLCLYRCKCFDIETIGGQLKKLKIFTISECEMIEELPVCMSEWTQLKVLQVLDCSYFKLIHPNIISKMTKLEELSLWQSFIGWGEEVSYKNKLIKNAELSELNCLTHLVHLELKVRNAEILSNGLSLETIQTLDEFHIYVGKKRLKSIYDNFAKTLDVYETSPIDSIGGAFPILLQQCEGLVVRDFVGFANLFCNPQYGNCGYPHLKYLEIDFGRSRDMTRGIGNFNLQVSFQLMNLWIIGANGLEILWPNKQLTTNSFFKLQRIYIYGCDKFTYMFPWCMVRLLVFLKSLTIKECKLLERIFEIEESTTDDVNDVNPVVPLTQLELGFLSKLKHLWNYDQSHELLTFPNLEEVEVVECPQLKTLFPAPFTNLMKEIRKFEFDGEIEIFGEANEASQLVPPEIVLFPSLRYLKIHCKLVNKRSFWVRPESFSVLETLHLIGSEDDGMASLPLETSELVWRSVRTLQITNAFELVQLFQNGEENNKNNHKSSSRGANLEFLCLDNLPNLTHVWEDNNDQMTSSSFDRLNTIDVNGCENLKCLLPSSISFFNLEYLTINKCNGMMNLFDTSVVRNLVNLQSMAIYYCTEMRYIIAAPKGEDEKREDIIFNRLLILRLWYLPRLASFQSGKCMLRFPSLEHLYISGCLEMKTFNSYGTMSTPKLSCVEIEQNKVSVSSADELNAIIEDAWKNKTVRSNKNLFTG